MFSLDNYAQFQTTTHPLLDYIDGNQYGNYQDRGINHPRAHPNFKSKFRPLAASGTNWHDSFSSGGPTGYGPSSIGYEQHHYPPAISAHSGSGGYGHSSPASTGYGAPHPHPHPPVQPPPTLSFGKFKKGGSSTMTALTLLSFFFFVNLLQSCLKEHMNTMNPTVMVMTSGVVRNRSNKLAEMNSREQSTSPASIASDGNIVIQPENLILAASSVGPVTVTPTVTIQSPYSGNILNQQNSILESHLKHQNPYVTASSTVNTIVHDTRYDYPNRTLSSSSSFASTENHQRPQLNYNTDNHYRPQHSDSDAYAWSYGSSSSSTYPSHNRYSSPYSASSSNSYYGNNNNYYNRDRDHYSDSYFTRIH